MWALRRPPPGFFGGFVVISVCLFGFFRGVVCLCWFFFLFCLSLFCILCRKFIYIVKRHIIASWRVHFALHTRHVILRLRCIQSHNISRATAGNLRSRNVYLSRAPEFGKNHVAHRFCFMCYVLFFLINSFCSPSCVSNVASVSGWSILFSLTFIYHVPVRMDLNTQCNTLNSLKTRSICYLKADEVSAISLRQ